MSTKKYFATPRGTSLFLFDKKKKQMTFTCFHSKVYLYQRFEISFWLNFKKSAGKIAV